MLRSAAVAAASLLLALALAGSAPAVGLPSPDVNAAFISVGYDAGSDTLMADGMSISIDGTNLVAMGVFELDATITGAGQLTGGTVFITGDTGGGLETLIGGDLIASSLQTDATERLIFQFSPNAGSLLPQYGGLDGQVRLSQTGFPGSFANDFSSSAFGAVADTAPVPEPSGLLLAAFGWLAVSWRVRSARRR